MQIRRIKGQITKAAEKALHYCNEKYLSKPYTDDPGTKFPAMYLDKDGGLQYYPNRMDQDFREAEKIISPLKKPDSKVVYRSNHGLCHTVCTITSSDDILEFNEKHAAESAKSFIKERTLTPDDRERFITKLQVAMVFYVSGRKGESGFHDTTPYNSYRESSAQNFLRYIDEEKLIPSVFDSLDEVNLYADCIQNSWASDKEIRENDKTKAPLKILLYSMHAIDLQRLVPWRDLQNSTVNSILRIVPNAANEKAFRDAMNIFAEAQNISITMGCSTGDTFIEGVVRWPKQDPEKFFVLETDVEKCINHVNEYAIQNQYSNFWENIKNNLLVLIKKYPTQLSLVSKELEILRSDPDKDGLFNISKIKQVILDEHQKILTAQSNPLLTFTSESSLVQDLSNFRNENFNFEIPSIVPNQTQNKSLNN